MADPQVPIDVDPETGVWRTDGLPMIYLPRHFLVNNHPATEAALGLDAYRRMLQAAAEKSATTWCRTESETHHLAPEATVRHYFRRLSPRGWGQFSLRELDIGRRQSPIRWIFGSGWLLRLSEGVVAQQGGAGLGLGSAP